MQQDPFGILPDGRQARLFTLVTPKGLVMKVTDFGTIITELHAPDRQGRPGDIVLGFDTLSPYLQGHPYFGCTVGRVANRIARGRFTLDGKSYQLAVNNGPNHLHGGLKGFDKVLWQAAPAGDHQIRFRYVSPDGEENYPGELSVEVCMTLTDDEGLRLDYQARTTAATPINLTNHTYFNLRNQGDVLGHEVEIAADFYTPSDENLIPTGEIAPVAKTLVDFAQPTALGARLAAFKSDPPGYDHNFVLRGGGTTLAFAGRAVEPNSGRVLEAYTTQPGMQLYTGNFLDGTLAGKGGQVYGRHSGFCFETQNFPDAINQPRFPTAVLRPRAVYQHSTIYRFTVH